jgi:glucose/mannose transport system substrate-binding protein
MIARTSLSKAALVVSLSALGLGCSDDSADEDQPQKAEDSLEIFSWWTSAGEAEALSALLEVFSDEQPGVEVTNAANDDPTTARETLKTRLQAGEPPDSFQAISGVDVMNWVAAGKMEPITALAARNGWGDVFPAAVTDILSRDGELYAVPVNIERDNNLYYNVQVLADHELEPPQSLDELYAACATLQAADVVPLAVPAAGWVLALVAFETLLPAVNGGEYYMDFLGGKADPDGPELRAFFEELAKVLECSNVATAEASWGVGGDLVYKGDAAMFVMGDWAKGYFEGGKDADGKSRRAWTPGVDFDVVPGLGSAGYYTFNSAVFGLPAGAQHPNAAAAFLTAVGSKAGQQAFNPVKGSVPARTDVDLAQFDDMVRASAADFATAGAADTKLLPGYASLTSLDFQVEINPSLLVFAVGGDRARSLDPDNVPEDEATVPALDVDYIIAKVSANYSLLER